MQIMNWTLNPAISMTRFSEATIRGSQLIEKKKKKEEEEEDSESPSQHQDTESEQRSSRFQSSVSAASDLERASEED